MATQASQPDRGRGPWVDVREPPRATDTRHVVPATQNSPPMSAQCSNMFAGAPATSTSQQVQALQQLLQGSHFSDVVPVLLGINSAPAQQMAGNATNRASQGYVAETDPHLDALLEYDDNGYVPDTPWEDDTNHGEHNDDDAAHGNFQSLRSHPYPDERPPAENVRQGSSNGTNTFPEDTSWGHAKSNIIV